jgi:hypothetical protein
MLELPTSQQRSSSWLAMVVVPRGRCIIERWLLVTAWGRLSARLCGAVHGRLVVGGVLGGDAARLLERARK